MTETLLEEDKIRETISRIPRAAFTILDFIDAFRSTYPDDWKRLCKRFGRFGSK